MVMSTLLGAWIGAVPIPLDWNRPWQVGLYIHLTLSLDSKPVTYSFKHSLPP